MSFYCRIYSAVLLDLYESRKTWHAGFWFKVFLLKKIVLSWIFISISHFTAARLLNLHEGQGSVSPPGHLDLLQLTHWLHTIFSSSIAPTHGIHLSFVAIVVFPTRLAKCLQPPIHPQILYNYHHSTKLYRKISWVCYHLYCYECTAWVTMPTATSEWYFFRYSLVLWW